MNDDDFSLWRVLSEEGYGADLVDRIFKRVYEGNGGTDKATPEDWDLHWRIVGEINNVCCEVLDDDQQLDFNF